MRVCIKKNIFSEKFLLPNFLNKNVLESDFGFFYFKPYHFEVRWELRILLNLTKMLNTNICLPKYFKK